MPADRLTESSRRVLAHLSEPRSLPNLTRVLRNDAYAPFDPDESFEFTLQEVAKELDQLAQRGWVVNVGSHQDATSALRAVASSDEAIVIPEVKAETLASRLESGRDSRLDTGELVILTKQGLEALQA